MALSTANAADLYGTASGVHYTLGGGYVAGTEEAFSTAISTATFSTWTDRTVQYDVTFQPHIDTVATANGNTWQLFKSTYGSDADFIGVYVNNAAVSPDFKKT